MRPEQRARERERLGRAAARRARAGARAPRPGAGVGDRERPRAYAINGRVDDGPVAPAAAHSPVGPGARRRLPRDRGAPAAPGARRAGLVGRGRARAARHARPARGASRFPPLPGPRAAPSTSARELALALAPLHEAGAAHGALRPGAVEHAPGRRSARARCRSASAGPADDVHGLGVLLLHLLTGRQRARGPGRGGRGRPRGRGRGPAAEHAGARSRSTPGLGAPGRCAARARSPRTCPDTAEPAAPAPPRRGAGRRVATAIVLLVLAGAAGAYVVGHRVGPAGPRLTPGTVSVPDAPAATP